MKLVYFFPHRFPFKNSGGSFPALKRPARFALKAPTYDFGSHDGSLNIDLNRPFKVKTDFIKRQLSYLFQERLQCSIF